MKNIKLNKIDIDAKQFKKKSAKRGDYKTLIKEYGMYQIDDDNSILYTEFIPPNDDLVKAFKNFKVNQSVRTGGLKSNSSLIGYRPRKPPVEDFCTITTSSYNQPIEHEIFMETSKKLAEIYKKYLPEMYHKHMRKLKEKNSRGEELLDEYILEQTPFTSGIVNKNNQLNYHYDAGNIKGVVSAMIVVKKDVAGGYLSLPEYDVAIELKNNSAIFFNGQNILHGVTPIAKASADAYRYSVVFYTLDKMWKCLGVEEELERTIRITEEKDANQ